MIFSLFMVQFIYYLQCPAKESTFHFQTLTPQMPLLFLLVSICSLYFMICTMYFVLFADYPGVSQIHSKSLGLPCYQISQILRKVLILAAFWPFWGQNFGICDAFLSLNWRSSTFNNVLFRVKKVKIGDLSDLNFF